MKFAKKINTLIDIFNSPNYTEHINFSRKSIFLFYFCGLYIIFSSSFLLPRLDIPKTYRQILEYIFIFAFTYFWFWLSRFMLSSKKRLNITYTFFITLILYYLFFSYMYTIMYGDIYFNFLIILMRAFIFTVLELILVINFIKYNPKKLFNIFYSMMLLAGIKLFYILGFGTYDNSIMPNASKIIAENKIEYFFRICQLGSQKTSVFPSFDEPITFFIQYVFGTTYNLVILGVFISFFSSYLSSEKTNAEDPNIPSYKYIKKKSL